MKELTDINSKTNTHHKVNLLGCILSHYPVNRKKSAGKVCTVESTWRQNVLFSPHPSFWGNYWAWSVSIRFNGMHSSDQSYGKQGLDRLLMENLLKHVQVSLRPHAYKRPIQIHLTFHVIWNVLDCPCLLHHIITSYMSTEYTVIYYLVNPLS